MTPEIASCLHWADYSRWGIAMVIDTNSSCRGKSAFLPSKEVTAVGRYYRVIRPEWALSKEEAAELSAAGIQIFTVYEDAGHLSKLSLTEDQGREHGTNAVNQARIVGQPEGSAIYFALEGLPHGYKSSHLPAIREYFAGVSAVVDSRFHLACTAMVSCAELFWMKASANTRGSQRHRLRSRVPWTFTKVDGGTLHRSPR